MYHFSQAEELIHICINYDISIAEACILAEVEESGLGRDEIWNRMEYNFSIMQESVKKGMDKDIKSIGGLIGGNAYRLNNYLINDKALSGKTIIKAVTYAIAVTEVNASMGKIVAAPTAGASGIVPGVIISIAEDQGLPSTKAIEALFVAGAIGKIIAINATLSGAEGGCQAECGSASAMAAAAAVHLGGGTANMCLDAASIALKNLLGLVCDPVAGLVEVPCSKRNSAATANAMVCADLALAGIKSFLPFDEVVEAMYRIGQLMSPLLKETAQGGCAIAPTALKYKIQL